MVKGWSLERISQKRCDKRLWGEAQTGGRGSSSGHSPFKSPWSQSDHPGSQPSLLLCAGDHSDPQFPCLTRGMVTLS